MEVPLLIQADTLLLTSCDVLIVKADSGKQILLEPVIQRRIGSAVILRQVLFTAQSCYRKKHVCKNPANHTG